MTAVSADAEAPRSRRHEDAIDAAAQTARRHGLSEEAFRDSVQQVRDDIDTYRRALHVIEKRTVHQRMKPGSGRSRDPKSLPVATSVDPWAIDVNELPTSSRAVGYCPGCLGSGATKCASCRGIGKIKCPRCDATGVGPRGGDCSQCGGQKKIPCGDCNSGQIECKDCKGSGEVEAWLEVERATRQEVCVHPMGSAARAHPRVSEIADFEAEPGAWPDTLAEDTGMRAPTDLGEGLVPKLRSNERVVSTRMQRFQTVVHLVSYATALSTGIVQVGGTPLEASPTSDWRPVELRRIISRGGAVVLLGVAIVGALSYNARHAWFARTGHAPVMIAAACAMALACVMVLRALLLTSNARTPLRLWVPAGALMLGVGATAMVVSRDRPRASHTRASLARGDIATARVEADALRVLDIDRATGESVLDELHTREVRAAGTDLARMITAVKRPWYRSEARDAASRAVAAKLEEAVDTVGVRDDPDALSRIADQAQEFAPPLRERLQRRVAMIRAQRCAEAGNGRCARDQTTLALQHGADPADVAPVLRRAGERVLERFNEAVAQSESAHSAGERVEPLQRALALSEEYGAVSREATSPAPMELRERLERAQREGARDEGAPHEGAPHHREHRRR